MIRFTVFGVPVEIQPWFWITAALLGGATHVQTRDQLLGVLVFMVVATLSILVHEFGHALTGRKLGGGAAHIVLWALGGLAYNQGGRFTRWQRFWMIFMGPGAGFLLLALVVAGLGGLACFAASEEMPGFAVLLVVLVLAAAPMTGSPGLTILAGGDPAPALRQLVLGTALLPLTVLPVFWLLPVFGAPLVVVEAALRLLAVIALAGGAGIVMRTRVAWLRGPEGQGAVDGLITLGMAVVVVGLMSAVGPALLAPTPALWLTLATVFVLGFGAQAATLLLTRHRAPQSAPALAVIAGNRNLALFLGALPPETAAALLLFVGLYQLPMYLTPLVMAPVIRRLAQGAAAP